MLGGFWLDGGNCTETRTAPGKIEGVLIAVLHTRPPFKYKNTSDLDPDASDDNNNKNKRNKK